jgi:hypothetical protein
MKLYFEAPRGIRLRKRFFMGATVFEPDLWWSLSLKKWVSSDEARATGKNYSTHADVHSVKAFKRMLRKNPILKGYAVFLENRYVGYSVSNKPFEKVGD